MVSTKQENLILTNYIKPALSGRRAKIHMKQKVKKQLPPELIVLLIIGIPFLLFQLIRFLIQYFF